MKRVWILLILLVGCVGSPVGANWSPALFMGGTHFVRSATDVVVAEGYLINTKTTVFDSRTFTLSVLLMGSENDITPTQDVPSGRNWEPGEVRKWSALFEGSPREPQKVFVGVNSEPYWIYVTRCRTPQGVVVDDAECPGLVQRPELTEDTESRFTAMLLECCDWIPPQLNIHELECRVELASIACAGKITNYRADDVNVNAEAILTEVGLEPGAGQREISRYALGDEAFTGDSTTAYDFEATIDPTTLAGAGHTYSMELRLANDRVPRSVANETSLLVLAQSPG